MITELIFPWFILSASAVAFFITIAKLLATGSLRTFASRSAFNDAWFGTLWTFVGPRSKKAGMPLVVPLLEGRLSRGIVHDKPVAQPLHGTIVEVGAGSGMWADAYRKVADNALRNGVPGPSKIYGVEPNHVSAAALRQRVQDIGLADIYEVVPVGIQDLGNASAWGTSIPHESVDCIVTVQCLCSIPEPEKNVALLYKYLKKGGHWYVYEHVRTDRGLFVWWLQYLIDLFFWRHMLGGCRLCRNTEKTLSHVAMWDKIDLEQPPAESSWNLVPHTVGTLRK